MSAYTMAPSQRAIVHTPDARSSDLPEELVYAILGNLTTKQLLVLKLVSRAFANTVDCLLRCRLMRIMADHTQELVFEAASPSQFRPAERQRVHITSFSAKDLPGSRLEASLAFDSGCAPVPRSLFLDEDVQFGGTMMGILLRGLNPLSCEYSKQSAPSAPPLIGAGSPDRSMLSPSFFGGGVPQPSTSGGRFTPPVTPPHGRSRASSPAATPAGSNSPAMTPPDTPRATWSVDLSNGFDRLYRSWFEDPAWSEDAPRASRLQTLRPSPASALLEARIACVQTAPAEPCGGVCGMMGWSASGRFEYSYESLTVDVARLLDRVEEGTARGCRGEQAVVMLQWRSPRTPYIIDLDR